jgi:hypothetical protein
MENNDTQDVDLENNVVDAEGTVETPTEEPTQKDEPSEPDWKAEAAKWKRIAERKSKPKAEDAPAVEPTKQSSDLDYGQKAYLKTYGIAGSDELQLVREYQQRTGDPLDALVEDDIFQAKLGKLREARAAAEAVPKSTNRSQSSTHDDVDYWRGKIDAGQASLYDIPDLAVRRKVLDARIEQEKSGSRFSDSPIQMT